MSELVIGIRHARPTDAPAIAGVFDTAWREAYLGVIPTLALERMIARRGPSWWSAAVGRGRPLVVLDAGRRIAGYASYGRCRDRTLPAQGEIDELGFGRRLFRAVLNDLSDRGMHRVAVWALADNERARAFYEGQGGRPIAETTERIGGVRLAKVAYFFS
jgi:L-amino acid N-acyltransferase YncA